MLIAESLASDGREYSGLDLAPTSLSVFVIRSRRTVGFGVPLRAARAAELGTHGRAEGCCCQTGPRPAGLLYEGPWWGCRLLGTGRSPR